MPPRLALARAVRAPAAAEGTVSESMPRMREKVAGQLRPMIEMLRAGMLPHGHLLAGALEAVVAHYEETFRVLDEHNRKLCWYEFCVTPEIFRAMDVHPFLGEVHPPILTLGTPELCWHYVDRAHAYGLPSEVCVLDKVMLGALLEGEMPQPDFIVTASAPCDSSRIGYQIFEQITGCPTLRLDAPTDDSAEAHRYYAGQLRKLIAFLEEQTGRRLDPDRLREVCEESNRACEAMRELLELRRAVPCPHPGTVGFNSYMALLCSLGSPELTRYLEFLRDDAAARVAAGRGAIPDERYRVLWYYVPVTFDFELATWLEETFGAVVITDALSSFLRADPVDTSDFDSMLVGLARRGLETTMGRLRVRASVLTERFLRDVQDFRADCVVFPSPVGCKHVWAWLGLLRRVCRERGIPLYAFDLDWMDSRTRSSEEIRGGIEQFFATVMS